MFASFGILKELVAFGKEFFIAAQKRFGGRVLFFFCLEFFKNEGSVRLFDVNFSDFLFVSLFLLLVSQFNKFVVF